MQKGRVLKLQSFGVFEFFKKNSFLLTVTLIFAVGIFIGIFTIDSISVLSNYSKDYITDYITTRTNMGFGAILGNSFLDYLAYLFVVFCLGASLFGVITVPFAVLFKGVITGGISAYLYSAFGVKGIAFNAVIVIPPLIVFLIILLVASRESVRFSLKFSSLTLSKTLPFNMSQDFKDYTVKYFILSLCCLVSSLIDAIISSGLIKHFTL